MKKVLAIVALLACGAGAAYGAFNFPTAAGTYVMGSSTAGQIDFKPSANVAMTYEAATSSGVSYVVGSVHGQGSRVFGTSSVDTNIFYIDVNAPGVSSTPSAAATVQLKGTTTAVTFPTTNATTPTTYFGTGWTASK